MANSKIPIGGYVKITDKELTTYSQIGRVRNIMGVYNVVIPNEETPDFLKNIDEREIQRLLWHNILDFYDQICFTQLIYNESICDLERIPCSIHKKNSKIDNCALVKVKNAYEVAPENYSVMSSNGPAILISDTQILDENQFEYLNKTVFDKDFRDRLNKKRERKSKFYKFLFSLPFVANFYLRRNLLENKKNLKNTVNGLVDERIKELEIEKFLES